MRIEYTPPKKAVKGYRESKGSKHQIRVYVLPKEAKILSEESIEAKLRIPKKNKKTCVSKKVKLLVHKVAKYDASDLVKLVPHPSGPAFNAAKTAEIRLSIAGGSMLLEDGKITNYEKNYDLEVILNGKR